MKKITLLIAMLMLTVALSSCGGTPGREYVKEVEAAIAAVKDEWRGYNRDLGFEPYLEIKNTRIVFVEEDAGEHFDNYDYVVEFVLFTNYYGSAPYYDNIGLNDSVVVYTDGSIEVQDKNPFVLYRSRTFDSEFSGIIKNIVDLSSSYNQVIKID